jgi:CheY-like chemotaxis protein
MRGAWLRPELLVGRRMKRILIVDDNEHERAIFARFLEFVGGCVDTAADGEEGVRTAIAQCPDLILLDLRMPGMDGWDTIRQLKADERTRSIPVLALTACHLAWERLRAAGFRGCMEKPIQPFRVLEEVERFTGRLDGPALREAKASTRHGEAGPTSVGGPPPGGGGLLPAAPASGARWGARARRATAPESRSTADGVPGPGIRVFRDRSGTEWQVSAVEPERPAEGERRRMERRRAHASAYTGPERRRGVDRRLAGGRAAGWLSFRSSFEERRLPRVPRGWEAWSDERLAFLCGLARRATNPTS